MISIRLALRRISTKQASPNGLSVCSEAVRFCDESLHLCVATADSRTTGLRQGAHVDDDAAVFVIAPAHPTAAAPIYATVRAIRCTPFCAMPWYVQYGSKGCTFPAASVPRVTSSYSPADAPFQEKRHGVQA